MPMRMVAGFIISAALTSAGPALGMEPSWPSGPYRYLVIDQDIKGVLAEFGRNTGLPVDVSDQVKGRLRGQVAAPTATAREFLDSLCDSHNLVWYFDGAVLHINDRAEIATELINLGRFSPADAREKLTELGIADARFPLRSTDKASVISVSGPPKFVTMVKQALRPPPRAQEDPRGDEVKVRVFRGGTAAEPPDLSVASRPKSKG
jgi:type II secretory pathway component GspD/PulD (secretin)